MYKSWERIWMGPQRQCLVPKKFEQKFEVKKNKEEKCKRKGIIEKKSERKKKDFKLINYFYMILQTHLIYFPLFYKD